MKVRLTKWGKAHRVATDKDGNPEYRTLCGQRIPMAGKELAVRDTDGDCVQCSHQERIRAIEANGGDPRLIRRQHKIRPLRNPRSDQAARRHRRRKKKKASRTREMMERAFRKVGRKDPPPEEPEDQSEQEERPGFCRFLRGLLPKFLKRGWGG